MVHSPYSVPTPQTSYALATTPNPMKHRQAGGAHQLLAGPVTIVPAQITLTFAFSLIPYAALPCLTMTGFVAVEGLAGVLDACWASRSVTVCCCFLDAFVDLFEDDDDELDSVSLTIAFAFASGYRCGAGSLLMEFVAMLWAIKLCV